MSTMPKFAMQIFSQVRQNQVHLTMKNPDGSFMASQDLIDELAGNLLSSKFYTDPWLVGCVPESVLFEKVILGLKSGDPLERRKSVNLAYNAEFRIIKMGVEQFIEWCRNGRDPLEIVESANDEPSIHRGFNLIPNVKYTSHSRLSSETRTAIEKVNANSKLLLEMPEGLRERFSKAHEDIKSSQLSEEFGELLLEIFEQWRLGRKQIIDLSKLIPEAIDQREEMLTNYPHSAVAVAHTAKLVAYITNPKMLAKLLKEGIAIQMKLAIPDA